MSQLNYRAVIRSGVAVPIEPFEIPDGTEVTVQVDIAQKQVSPDQIQQDIFDILSHTYDSGHTDTAARHNEHQP